MSIRESISPLLSALYANQERRTQQRATQGGLRLQALREIAAQKRETANALLRRQYQVQDAQTKRGQQLSDLDTQHGYAVALENLRHQNDISPETLAAKNRIALDNARASWKAYHAPVAPRAINYPSKVDLETNLSANPDYNAWNEKYYPQKSAEQYYRFGQGDVQPNIAKADSILNLPDFLDLKHKLDSTRTSEYGSMLRGLNPGMQFGGQATGQATGQVAPQDNGAYDDTGDIIDQLTQSYNNRDMDEAEYDRRLTELVQAGRLSIEGYQALSPYSQQ